MARAVVPWREAIARSVSPPRIWYVCNSAVAVAVAEGDGVEVDVAVDVAVSVAVEVALGAGVKVDVVVGSGAGVLVGVDDCAIAVDNFATSKAPLLLTNVVTVIAEATCSALSSCPTTMPSESPTVDPEADWPSRISDTVRGFAASVVRESACTIEFACSSWDGAAVDVGGSGVLVARRVTVGVAVAVELGVAVGIVVFVDVAVPVNVGSVVAVAAAVVAAMATFCLSPPSSELSVKPACDSFDVCTLT